MSDRASGWRFWIDRGGTFTDVVALDPDGRLATMKLLSENPESYEDAALEGIRRFLGVASDAPIPFERISEVKMGTTVATNALLERTGERTALLITRGFADLLAIGYQNRPDLFALAPRRRPPLYEKVVEIDERLTANAQQLVAPDLEKVRAQLEELQREGFTALAIAFMHADRFPLHEQQVAALARRMGFAQVSVSHEVSPLMKLVPRGDTTVADAYLTPVLRRYVNRIAAALGALEPQAETPLGGSGSPAPDPNNHAPRLFFMMSSGGLTSADHFAGKDAILSGPAGGVIGMVRTAQLAGFDKVIGFDMGGTSTDVAHFDGEYERSFENEVAGIRLRAPMLRIHTVAAGGGSILRHEQRRFQVGPQSAGANPGPKSYRRGGPLAITDANLLLGRIQAKYFPAIFGPSGDQPLDVEAVRAAFAELARQVGGMTPEEVAEGFLRIATENMANPIKKISIQRGRDVTGYLLNCFGGAGAQFACRIAEALGMRHVLIHPLAGVLSAYGIGLAHIRAERARGLELQLDAQALKQARRLADELEQEALAELEQKGVAQQEAEVRRRCLLRYAGTDTALEVALADSPQALRAAFEAEHERLFGFVQAEKPLIIEAVAVQAEGGGAEMPERPIADTQGQGGPAAPQPLEQTDLYVNGAWRKVPLFDRAQLRPGHEIAGPAIIIEPNSQIVVDPGWRASLNAYGHLLLECTQSSTPGISKPAAESGNPDPVLLEVFNNLFMNIAEQMGEALRATASSVNIKERLDFSCAVFDADGALVANAPHMPVHLGSMDRAVEAVIRAAMQDRPASPSNHLAPSCRVVGRGSGPVPPSGKLQPDTMWVLNAPYGGGTHLPDITVVAPVFLSGGERPDFFVAARGHHADIGGKAPGSMSPDATTIDEEGILIEPFLLVEGGRFREEEMRALLASGPYPARNPDQNIADLKAQAAACRRGIAELKRVVAHFGLDVVRAYMSHVQANAEESVRQVIDALKDGEFTAPLDNGARICVRIRVDRAKRRATVDFTGTSPQTPDNLNAPEPITRAAVLYAFRCMVGADIPMNAGCLKPIDIIVPEGSLLAPRPPAAVAAGNVETSQVVVDALFAAMNAMAAAQGTMNNFTFGDATRQYYETICGGAGAGPGWHGESAIHTHMTNTRLTDPEVLEFRYPVLVERFAIRAGSGGAGRWRGGEGVERIIRFREPMTVGLLTNRRRTRPFGLAGGGDAAPGENWLRRADGTLHELPSAITLDVDIGDAIIIRTPGGGGWGAGGDGGDE